MTEKETKLEREAEHERRRKCKRKSGVFTMMGFLIFVCTTSRDNVYLSGSYYWIALALSLGLVAYGYLVYLPIGREEKRETDEWHRQYQAEVDAANIFVFGTAQCRT